DGEAVKIFAPVRVGQHVVRRGSDVRRGSTVVRTGEVMTPAKVGVLAAIGRAQLKAFARPRVSILTTGDELVPPGQRIRPGQVYDINTYTMAAVTGENGGEPILLGRVSDRAAAVRTALRRGLDNDLVVFTGGSSAGERDLVVGVQGEQRDHLDGARGRIHRDSCGRRPDREGRASPRDVVLTDSFPPGGGRNFHASHLQDNPYRSAGFRRPRWRSSNARTPPTERTSNASSRPTTPRKASSRNRNGSRGPSNNRCGTGSRACSSSRGRRRPSSGSRSRSMRPPRNSGGSS